MAENRLSRWSRLKAKGGADAREEARVAEEKTQTEIQAAQPEDPFATLPGGARARHFVPAMAPLAPDPEDDDDRMTRGIGHAEPLVESDDAAGVLPAEPALADGDNDEELFQPIDTEELSEEEREVVAGLPPLDTLDKDSDFTPFLRDGVPEFLKRRALRLLWRLNPFFNFRDGLNDYDEDFNIVHRVIDEMVGNYKVGRGHLSEKELRDMMPEEARKAFGEEEPEQSDDEDADADENEREGEDGDLEDGDIRTSVNRRDDTDDADDDVGDGEDDE